MLTVSIACEKEVEGRPICYDTQSKQVVMIYELLSNLLSCVYTVKWVLPIKSSLFTTSVIFSLKAIVWKMSAAL